MAATGIMRVNTWPYSSCGLPSAEVTFAEQTKQAGYKNGFIGKTLSYWHLYLKLLKQMYFIAIEIGFDFNYNINFSLLCPSFGILCVGSLFLSVV